MANRLAQESSPYLLQHQHNPVDWYPWGPEALARAQAENKPIFLSIGYAACHWCHVMERESFEDPRTAALMNALFVNIKVDREERPDLDAIYMQAVVALTRNGGWPMSVFLTPQGQPFYGGTYFPPTRRYNMPAFQEVLQAVAHAWATDHTQVRQQAGRLAEHLQTQLSGLSAADGSFSTKELDGAVEALNSSYDWQHGGWGHAPKFPQPMAIEFLLRQASRGSEPALKMALHALDAMAAGGMYDVVGGGFARYSVDDLWLVPHFEKMLYDNAQLAPAYLHAWLLTGKPAYRRVVEETLDFVAREMTNPEGGFYASLDADSEGEEGKFYVWSPAELAEALPEPDLLALVTAAYGVTQGGNFDGKTVLQRRRSDAELSAAYGIAEEAVPRRLAAAHRLLLEARNRRVRPATDDKCVTAWNGLMLAAFSEAARYLKNDVYRLLAIRNGEFLMRQPLLPGGRLARTWRQGRPGPLAFLEDYAAAALGFLSLYQTDPQPRWFTAARKLADEMITLFLDPAGGFFDTGSDAESLIVRPKDQQDNATPCGGSLAASLLLQLAAFTADSRYRDLAEAALAPLPPLAAQYPTAFSNWLCAADFAAGPVLEIAIVGDQPEPLLTALWSAYRPHLVAAAGPGPSPHPPLLADRLPVNGRTAAYVCRNFTCLQPLTNPDELLTALADGAARSPA